MLNYWPEGKNLKNFSSKEQHCMICDIYNLFFDTARLSFYHNENGDFQQETLMFLLLFFQFFTGVKISAFGNLNSDRK